MLAGIVTAVGPSPQIAMRGPMNLAIWASFNTALTTTNNSANASVAAGGAIAPGAAINSVNVPPGTTWKTFAGTAGTLAFPTKTLYGRYAMGQAAISDLPETADLLGSVVTHPAFPAGITVTGILKAAVPPSSGFAGTKGIVQVSALPTVAPTDTSTSAFAFALGPQSVTTGVDANALFTGAGIVYTGTIQLERSFDGGQTPLVCNIGTMGTLAQWSAGTPVNIAFGEPEKMVFYRFNCTAYTVVAGVNLNVRLSTTGSAAESLAVNQLS